MYADDHQTYEEGQNMCTVLAKLQKSATLATNWYDSKLLQGDLKKYQTMSIRNKSLTDLWRQNVSNREQQGYNGIRRFETPGCNDRLRS